MKRSIATKFRSRRVLNPVPVIRFLGVLVFAAMSAFAGASGEKDETPMTKEAATEIAIYALSSGRGVPEATRAALRKARKLVDDGKQRGEVLKVTEARIGLEGERRLCVEAKDVAAARVLLRELRRVSEGVELFNVVEEPCLKK